MPLHPLHTDLPRPATLNNPFCYEPDPLCLLAVEEVKAYVAAQSDWHDEVQAGKMFGVLVCEDADGQLGFLAAYSGQIQGREDHPWFVPAVFDYLQADGYFKQEEARISAINSRVTMLESANDYVSAQDRFSHLQAEAESEISAYKTMMQEAKRRRDALRTESQLDALIRESQFQKAELRRLKRRWQERLASAEAEVKTYADEIARLRQERKQRSDALQRWLFDHFEMLNQAGERRSLTAIFAPTAQQVPPSGSGECCAPKLLQYAFLHHLRPLCMAEFWQGRSPRMEVRHHDHYYPACQGKCKPILEWMIGAGDGANGSYGTHRPYRSQRPHKPHTILYADAVLLVIDKPAGMLSVPGKSDEPSVETMLRQQYPSVRMVHRLDMDTSGLMVVALTDEAYHHLQRQFDQHTIYKRYIALLDGVVHGKGTINLALRPDLTDRPRQLVDHQYGKTAVTDYEVLDVSNGITRISLIPHTGRTHQLRMHCAHEEGLGTPIKGDPLYGRRADRLYLHAEVLSFNHPVSGERLTFTSTVPF